MKWTWVNLALLLFACGNAGAISYGAYGHHNLGSGKVLGLAGAYTSLSDDSNVFLYNPAGTGFADWSYHFEAASNTLANDEMDLDQNGVGKAQAQNLLLFGAHFKGKYFSFGLGQYDPYSVSLVNNFSATEKKLSLKNTAANLSVCPLDFLCLGINYTLSTATQSIHSSSENTSQIETQNGLSYGLSFRHDDDFGLGYSLAPKYSWDFSNPKSNYFSAVMIPSKESIGIFWQLKKMKSKLVIDWEKIQAPGDNVFAFESNEFTNLTNIQNKSVSIYKIGIDSQLVQKQKTSVNWRLGYYLEPSRIESDLNRSHFCIGLEARIGPALLQVALDQARSFTNTSQSFSILIDRL